MLVAFARQFLNIDYDLRYVCPSISQSDDAENPDSHLTHFTEILYWKLLRKFCRCLLFLVQIEKDNRHFT